MGKKFILFDWKKTLYLEHRLFFLFFFSHVFETVEKNSIEIWKYQMYFLVMEYENKTFLVPPFSLFQHIFLAVRWIGRKTCCYRKKDSKFLFIGSLELKTQNEP